MNIDYLLNEFLSHVGYRPTIEFWKWHGQPGFIAQDTSVDKQVDWSIGYIIQTSKDSDCLSSQSEYVRECKAWLNHNRVDRLEWAYNLGSYTHVVMNFIHQLSPKTTDCCCGAKHTSFPGIHSHWCDAYVET